MIWSDLRGRDVQVEMFRRAIGRGRLASAYLLVGPDGTGKALFARKLAQCLLCAAVPDDQLDACGTCPSCRSMQAGTHPDFHLIACPEGKSEIPIEAFVGARESRGREGLCHDLSIRPMAGERKIAVIDGADRMNEESANALLKTLEEPPPYALMILTASNVDSLLPTIRSRCQTVRFGPLSNEDVEELLLANGLVADAADARATAQLSEGSLATAAQLLDPQLRGLRDKLCAALAAERYQPAPLAKDLLAGLESLGNDAPSMRRHAQWLLRFALEFYRSALRALSEDSSANDARTENATAGQYARRLDPGSATDFELLMELYDRVAAAGDGIERMAPVPLSLEALFADLGRIQRSRPATRRATE